MIALFLFAWLFAIPIFAQAIAKTGECYRDIITPVLFSRQHFEPGAKHLLIICQCMSYAEN
jgi:hypothetical protein